MQPGGAGGGSVSFADWRRSGAKDEEDWCVGGEQSAVYVWDRAVGQWMSG